MLTQVAHRFVSFCTNTRHFDKCGQLQGKQVDLALFYKSIAQLLLFFHVVTTPSPSFPASAHHNSSPATTSDAVDGACGAGSCDTTTSTGVASPAQDEAAIKALISHQPNSKSHLCVSSPCLMSHLRVSSPRHIAESHVSSPCKFHLCVSSPCIISHRRVSYLISV